MRECVEGEKLDVLCRIEPDPGVIVPTGQFRIVDAARALKVAWASAIWDSTNRKMYGRFDSTATATSVPGKYYVQFLVTIGTEVRGNEQSIILKDWGP